MTLGGKILIGISSGLLLVANTVAATPNLQGNPYEPIVQRNVFNVHPAPPVVVVPPAKPRPSIKLTGVTTITGEKRALFDVQFPPASGTPAHAGSYMLAEGQSQDGITVVTIDANTGTVEFKFDDGVEESLNLMKDGAKAPSGGGATPLPQLPRPGTPAPQVISAASPGSPNPASSVTVLGGSKLPTRNVRVATGAGGEGGGRLGVVTSGMGATATTPNQKPGQLSADEQMVLIELERERTKAQVEAGKMPPLPPTPITPPGAPGSIKPAAPPPP